MSKKTDKLHSEFEEKLNESRSTDRPVDRDTRDEYRNREEAYRREDSNRPEDRTETIPVIEEQVEVSKQTVETGRVRISKGVREEEVDIDLPTTSEEVSVERVEVNKYVETAPPPVRYEGETMIIPVVREVMVVEKKILVVEELHVTKRQVKTHDTQRITLRKEEVNVNRDAVDPSRR
jgi:uncharacterized protein (TIGR02271 family)